jgi:hypothetical protein
MDKEQERRKQRCEGLMDSLSEYFDYEEADYHFHSDLIKNIRELHRYHQTRASKLKTLLGRLELMS